MEQKGDQPRTKLKEIDKVKLLEVKLVTGKYNGVSQHCYKFSYNGIDEKWHEGQVSLINENQENFDEAKGNLVSFWTAKVEKEEELKELTSSLFQISHEAFMQPLFCVYNSQIDKIIMACSPGTTDFNKWISKQKPISLDGYITVQGKQMISSVLVFGDTLWKKGFVCTGLEHPNTYRMWDTKIKVIPFAVRKRLENDDPMIHRLSFATMLKNQIHPKWKDPDLEAFIGLMKNPMASIEDLLSHPLLLQPQRRLALYQTLYPSVLSLNQITLLQSLPKFDKWTSKINVLDELHGVLTYGGDGKRSMYAETNAEAFRFGCNASSHYMTYWKQNTHFQLRKIDTDYADKSLKKVLPGLLAQVYGLTFNGKWRC